MGVVVLAGSLVTTRLEEVPSERRFLVSGSFLSSGTELIGAGGSRLKQLVLLQLSAVLFTLSRCLRSWLVHLVGGSSTWHCVDVDWVVLESLGSSLHGLGVFANSIKEVFDGVLGGVQWHSGDA